MQRRVVFGRTSHTYPPPAHPAFVPHLFGSALPSPNTTAGRRVLLDLEWLLQKDLLGQDACLVGPPGPYRRRLVSFFCELTGRELESVLLSQDTSESDLKQRRDLRDGTVHLTPQPPLRAAVLGRVLLLDGIEKAERNVLPTLNNLLENREMHLLHGQRLVSPWHPSATAEEGGDSAGDPFAPRVLRTHSAFRCIALQLPVPMFPGQPIDPPLRSRFQGRVAGGPAFIASAAASAVAQSKDAAAAVSTPAQQEHPHEWSYLEALNHLRELAPSLPTPAAEAYLSAVLSLQHSRDACSTNVPMLPLETLVGYGAAAATIAPSAAKPSSASEPETPSKEAAANALRAAFARYPVTLCGVLTPRDAEQFNTASQSADASVTMANAVEVLRAKMALIDDGATNQQQQQQHFAIVGPRGSGKTIAVMRALELARRHSTADAGSMASPPEAVRVMTCFKDMTTRDLYERRVMDDKGDSAWLRSPLIAAAEEGGVLVLDGIHRCSATVLAALAPLLHDGDAQLPSGRRLMRADRFNALAAKEAARRGISVDEARDQMRQRDNVSPVQRGFLVVGVGEPGSHTQPWLTTETMTLFPGGFVAFRSPSTAEAIALARAFIASADDRSDGATAVDVSRALDDAMQAMEAASVLTSQRTVERLARAVAQTVAECGDRAASDDAAPSPTTDHKHHHPAVARLVQDHLRRALLLPFRPLSVQQALRGALERVGFLPLQQQQPQRASDEGPLEPIVTQCGEEERQQDAVRWGPVRNATSTLRVGLGGPALLVNGTVEHPELVPATSMFHVIPSQMRLLRDVTADMARGERHLLLIGNQGTGKNKLCDTLLSLLRLEREYIQLHRDTSVQALTVAPTIDGRRLHWELSPLIRAAVEGRVAVIDEADKAPLEVVCLLKALLADEHLTLIDGRTVRRRRGPRDGNGESDANSLFIHPDFRVIVLANRPGFPFLGNDFFRECGDVFACHIVDNPDVESALALISHVAPSIPRSLLARLAGAFGSLREKHEAGELPYPFSARELVAVAKHLQAFPASSVAAALRNVMSFDAFAPSTSRVVLEALERHGLVLDGQPLVALGATATLTEFPAPGAGDVHPPILVPGADGSQSNVTITTTTAAVVTLGEVHYRNMSNEISQAWRDHSGGLPSFVPPRAYSFSELIHVAQLPFVGTPYRKTPVAAIRLADCKRRDRGGVVNDDGEAARPGYLILGSPTSLFVYNADLTTCHEIDAVFTGGAVSSMLALDAGAWSDGKSSGWALLCAEASTAVYTLHVSGVRVRKYPLPAELYAMQPNAKVPFMNKQGHRYANTDATLCRYAAPDGTVAYVNRASGALCVLSLSPTERTPARSVFVTCVPEFAQSNITEIYAVEQASQAETQRVTVVWRGVGETESGDDAFLNVTTVTTTAGRDGTASIETRSHRVQRGAVLQIAAASLVPQSSLLAVLAVNPAHNSLSLQTVNTDDGSVKAVAAFPPGVLPPTHQPGVDQPPRLLAHQVRSWARIGFTIRAEPRLAASVPTAGVADSHNATNSYVISCTLNVKAQKGGDEAVASTVVYRPESLALRRVNLGASHAALTLACLLDAGNLMLVGDKASTLQLLQVSSSALGSAKRDWEAQLGHGDANEGNGKVSDKFEVSEVSGGGGEEVRLEYDSRPAALEQGDSNNAQGDEGDAADTETGDGSSQLDGEGTAGQSGEGQGSGAGHGRGAGFGSGGSGDGGSGGGQGSGGAGADKQSDGLGGYSFDSEGEAVISSRKRRQLTNMVQAAAATGEPSYDIHLSSVADSIALVAASIEALEATQKEREWLGNSSFGELDDRKLVDAVAGEPTVFMRRGFPSVPVGMPQRRPKYMDIVVDLSASMARFNAFDGRLDRICESLVLLMEAARGMEHKLVFEVHGHSGSAVRLPLLTCASVYTTDADKTAAEQGNSNVEKDSPARMARAADSSAVAYEDLAKPTARADVLAKCVSHSRMAMTGDGTVEGLRLALANAAENVDADERFVILVSDANLGGYGVSPEEIGGLLAEYRPLGVRGHVVFIAEENAADWFVRKLPPGAANVCTSTSELPQVLCSIWTEALLDS
jgi:MoxR-like ATPase